MSGRVVHFEIPLEDGDRARSSSRGRVRVGVTPASGHGRHAGDDRADLGAGHAERVRVINGGMMKREALFGPPMSPSMSRTPTERSSRSRSSAARQRTRSRRSVTWASRRTSKDPEGNPIALRTDRTEPTRPAGKRLSPTARGRPSKWLLRQSRRSHLPTNYTQPRTRPGRGTEDARLSPWSLLASGSGRCASRHRAGPTATRAHGRGPSPSHRLDHRPHALLGGDHERAFFTALVHLRPDVAGVDHRTRDRAADQLRPQPLGEVDPGLRRGVRRHRLRHPAHRGHRRDHHEVAGVLGAEDLHRRLDLRQRGDEVRHRGRPVPRRSGRCRSGRPCRARRSPRPGRSCRSRPGTRGTPRRPPRRRSRRARTSNRCARVPGRELGPAAPRGGRYGARTGRGRAARGELAHHLAQPGVAPVIRIVLRMPGSPTCR